jgi:uncharacterized protein (TIRG00374 family)
VTYPRRRNSDNIRTRNHNDNPARINALAVAIPSCVQSSPPPFPAYLAGWSVVHLLRAARWRLLLAPLGQIPMRRVLEASFLGYLAILVLPLRAGEVVRPVLIRRGGEVSAWAAAGTIGAERIVDGLTMSTLLFVALQVATLLDPLPETLGDLPIRVAIIPGAAYAALLVFACALLVMLAFFTWRASARRVIHAVFGLISQPLATWVATRVESVSDGLRFLTQLRYGGPFVLVTVLYWLSNAACTWLLAWGVGFEVFDYSQACVVTGVLALGILVPNAPGFFGAFQFSLYAGLALFYPGPLVSSLGAAFVLLVYLSQVAVTFGFAGWALISGRLSAR